MATIAAGWQTCITLDPFRTSGLIKNQLDRCLLRICFNKHTLTPNVPDMQSCCGYTGGLGIVPVIYLVVSISYNEN